LTPEQRKIVLLADVEGCSYQEIGQIVGCSVGTVRSRLHRARGQLRKLVNRYMKSSS
jgi:RNA polymerase sigma-70 factor (ECF subfamily)